VEKRREERKELSKERSSSTFVRPFPLSLPTASFLRNRFPLFISLTPLIKLPKLLGKLLHFPKSSQPQQKTTTAGTVHLPSSSSSPPPLPSFPPSQPLRSSTGTSTNTVSPRPRRGHRTDSLLRLPALNGSYQIEHVPLSSASPPLSPSSSPPKVSTTSSFPTSTNTSESFEARTGSLSSTTRMES